MRPVSGLERPWIQWTFVALGLLLVGLAAVQTMAIRRARADVKLARAAEMNARLDRQQLEMQLARERSAREALSIDVARLRGSAADAGAAPPALTLMPLTMRGATPAGASIDAPGRDVVIELRLVLPRTAPAGLHDFAVAIRTWSSGKPVWMRGGLARTAGETRPAITALITGDTLLPGAYELLLTAVSADGQGVDVGSYELSVAAPQR